MRARAGDDMGFEAEWQRWQDARWRLVAGPHGIAALTATVWLSAHEQAVPGVAGRWCADADAVVGTGLADAGYERTDGTPVGDAVVLHAGETLHAGDALLRAFVREDVPALRRVDPSAERRVRLRSIAAYRPDPGWIVEARWTATDEPIEVEQVDGHRTAQGDPMPPRGNELDVAVTAGERLPIYEES